METRVLKVFTDEDIAKIATPFSRGRSGEGYEDIAGFCKSASLEEIEKNGFPLRPEGMLALDADEMTEFYFQIIRNQILSHHEDPNVRRKISINEKNLS